jgi:MFS family permease
MGPVAAVLLTVLPGTVSLGFVLGCLFLRGPIVNALFFSYVAVLVPDRLQGRVMGAVMFMSYVAQPIGIFGIGWIFDIGGAHWVFAFMGVVSALAALPTLTRRIRRLPAPHDIAMSGSTGTF